jgi:hypothetical protein
VAEKLINAACWPDYNLSDGVLEYKNIIVIEKRNRLVGAAHDSYTRGHAGVQNSYKRLKAFFYWHAAKQMVN